MKGNRISGLFKQQQNGVNHMPSNNVVTPVLLRKYIFQSLRHAIFFRLCVLKWKYFLLVLSPRKRKLKLHIKIIFSKYLRCVHSKNV